MKEILDKITSYNLFNYLLPGVLFAFIATKMTGINFIQNDLITGVFLYYFIGLVVSRFGSLIIEPFLKWTTFLKFSEYKDYVTAAKKDAKIDILSEVNNMYRTIVSLIVLLGVIKLFLIIETKISWLAWFQEWNNVLIAILLLLMFLLSYKKQTKYIRKRIESNK